tara:strand:- start:922 stop:1308 length:387 start_codon:yes stop_codon:yes gene_type:complete
MNLTNSGEYRKLSVLFLIVFNIGWGLNFFSIENLIIVGIVNTFLCISLIVPIIIKPIYLIWMKIGLILGMVVSHILLLGIFALVFIPIGLLIKLFRIDPLVTRIEENKESYWIKKVHDTNIVQYKKQY